MLKRYRAAFAPPGAAAFSAAGLIARFPLAIYPIAIVLIVSGRTHAYGFAGVVSGSYVLGSAVGGPVAGLLVDRYGQRAMLRRFLLAQAISAAAFGALVVTQAPLWTLLVPGPVMGATFLNVGALIRARWSGVFADAPSERSTAYSVESVLDEVVFVLGPLVATVLATHSPALVTLSLAVLLIGAGSLWLAAQRATEPPVQRRPAGVKRDFALSHRGMQLITWVMVFMGAVFGSAEVVMIAFCGQHGQRSSAGWVVACFAGGSGLAGIAYGARHWNLPILPRFVLASLAFGVLPLLYFVPRTVPALAVCTALVGLGIAPTLIGGFGLVESIVTSAVLTEGLTWIGTGLSVGYGLGAAVVGGIADRHGAHLAFAVPAGCALAAAGCALALAYRMRSAPLPVAAG